MIINRKVQFTLVLLGFLVIFSCAHSHKNRVVPDWITNQSVWPEDKICALGQAGPTFYETDAINKAKDAARTELGKVIHFETRSLFVERQKGGKGGVTGSAESISAGYSEAEVKGSEIIFSWYDKNGDFSGGKLGIAYALACLPRS